MSPQGMMKPPLTTGYGWSMATGTSSTPSSWSILDRDHLEDERRWALVFGLASAVAILLISYYDVDEESVSSLLLVSIPVVVGYGLRAADQPIPAWTMPLISGVVQVAALLVDEEAEGHAFLLLFALFYAFFRERRRRMAGFALVCVLPLPFILYALDLVDSDGWLYWTMGYLLCAWFGGVAYQLRVMAEQLRQQRSLATAQAVSEERRRIAGDVHDLVGHSLSVMMLQLTGARRIVAADPTEAAEALGRAEDVGREAMAEIRRTIGMLHDRQDGSGPVPSVADLPALVDRYREAGASIDLTVDGDLDGIETARRVAAYRIVQEAVANAVKHNTDPRIEVMVEQRDHTLTLRIVNHGGTPLGTATRRVDDGQGFGLVGMRERARSVGGSLLAGPAAGGWEVEATLPRTGQDQTESIPNAPAR